MYLINIILGIALGFSTAYVVIAKMVSRTSDKSWTKTEFEKFSSKPIKIIKKKNRHKC
ncbi:MAG: hypothetical protein IJC76_10800 [Lachnospiraceae bacterium]|nr:hypothetical protein [Lachnospiraceae bacterium]